MTVDPSRYRKNKGARRQRHHRKQINIRLQRAKSLGGPPSRTEVLRALQSILDHGAVPSGWRLAVIEWQTPGSARGLITGAIEDMESLRPVIEAAMYGARIAQVDPEDA